MISIGLVLILLGICTSIDYADDSISNINESSMPKNIPKGTIIVDNSTVSGLNESASMIVVKSSDKVHIKQKYPTVTITAKPSCGCGKHYSYRWRTRTFVDYCPHCHRYGVLRNVHKPQAKWEQELTCKRCGADYCGNCGHEKYSYSKYYLKKA